MRTTSILILLAVILYGCAPDITETEFFRGHPSGDTGGSLIALGGITTGGLTFNVLAEDSLHFGHSPLLIEVVQGTDTLSSGSITVSSRWVTEDRILDMPDGDLVSSTNEEGQFETEAFFLQPSGEDGSWELVIDYDAAGVSGTVEMSVDVKPDIWIQYVGGSGDYYVSWEKPEDPSTGNDDFEVSIIRITEDGLVPVTGAQIDLYPYMDMGAGEGHSTPFEPPVHTSDGHYKGMVNFIMSGGWDMTLYVTLDGAAEPDTVAFTGFIVGQ